MKKLSKVSLTKKLSVVLAALTIIMVFIPTAQAKQYGSTVELSFNPLVFEDPTEPIWVGTISGEIDGTMVFWATGPNPSKDLGHPPGFPWQVHFFTEYWEITDDEGDWIAGIDNGNTGYSNWKYRMNGVVTEATGKYVDLVGHRVHMHGQIEWTVLFDSGDAVGLVIIN